MQFKFVFLILSVVALSHLSQAKIYTKCALAKELFASGIPKSELPDWVCIAQHESSYNTAAMNKNTNGTKDWGIFQINDRWWCAHGESRKSANECKVKCSLLAQDNITAAIKCAKQIKKQQGFSAWVAWKNKCQKNKPSVSECF